jgi:chemotaxis protein MotB
MLSSLQSAIFTLLAGVLLIIILGLGFLITDRLAFNGYFTGGPNKADKIRFLRQQLNEVTVSNEQFKGQVEQLMGEVQGARSELASLPQYKFTQTMQSLLAGDPSIHMENGELMFGNPLFFSRGSSDLSKGDQQSLNTLTIKLMKLCKKSANVPWIIRVEGHSDSPNMGPENEYDSNWLTSYKRALSVVQYFISKGLDAKRFYVASFSGYYPVVPKASKENRRVLLSFEQM